MNSFGRRRSSGEYPDLLRTDAISNATVTLFRNSANKVFGDRDEFAVSAEWLDPDEIPAAYELVEEKERALAAENAFAWSPDFGYLSPFPVHCGTGLVVQASFHLEGLHIIGDLPPVFSALDALRFNCEGFTADGIVNAAYVFCIYNRSTIGMAERDLLARVKRVFSDLADQERAARKSLVEEHPVLLADAVERALATLRHARLLSPIEYADLLSPVYLASLMGFIEGASAKKLWHTLRSQLEKPMQRPPETFEEERLRDGRDARFAGKVNAAFANVRLNDRAKEILS